MTIKKWLLLAVLSLCIVVGALCIHFFIPTKATKINDDVVKIEIFNGHNGTKTTITDAAHIAQIVEHFNNIEYLKTGIAAFRLGYYLDLSFLDTNDKVVKNFIVNSAQQLRYRGFFYEPRNALIDLEVLGLSAK